MPEPTDTRGGEMNDSELHASEVTLYVDHTNGLDTNDGLTHERAKKTIQAAWDDLTADPEKP